MKPKALSDAQRIREIIRILIEPYQDLEHMTIEHKVWSTMQPEKYPIFTRKILEPMKVFGMWWMDEEQYCQYLWNGHKGIVVKSDQDPDRVLATRSFMPKGYCYIRQHPDGTYDLEALSMTRHKGKSAFDYMTVSVTSEEYESLDKFLGPIQDRCKHDYEGMIG